MMVHSTLSSTAETLFALLTLSQVAETLYNRGFISYPRTETDSFVEGTDLNGLIAIHTADPNWGNYAQQYANQNLPSVSTHLSCG